MAAEGIIFDHTTRIDHLHRLRESPSVAQGKQKLYYKGETQYYPIYKINLNYLLYNKHNGRLETEMLTWEKMNSVSPDHYDSELHLLIDNFLWNSNKGRNRATLNDLKEKGQQKAGIVSLDGVIIDGNRRAMLLRRLAQESNQGAWFDAIILPDSYHENEKEIVRLETQYQLGEDEKVEYGPLQKYLHVKRLLVDLKFNHEEVADLMNQSLSTIRNWESIMKLMDDYLAHIGCNGLYTMLGDSDGTKEGMLVDLNSDLNRLDKGNPNILWDIDSDLEALRLKLIQFDYMRWNDFADAKKTYREISHLGSGKNFLADKEIWERFANEHQETIDPITEEMGTLDDFVAKNPDFKTREDAARARDRDWKDRVGPAIKRIFGTASSALDARVSELEPKEFLQRAWNYLDRVEFDGEAFALDEDVQNLVHLINSRSYEIKKALKRARN